MSENASDRTATSSLRASLAGTRRSSGDSHGGLLHQVMLDRSPDLVFLLGQTSILSFTTPGAVARLRGGRLLGINYSAHRARSDLELARNLHGRSDGIQQAELRCV